MLPYSLEARDIHAGARHDADDLGEGEQGRLAGHHRQPGLRGERIDERQFQFDAVNVGPESRIRSTCTDHVSRREILVDRRTYHVGYRRSRVDAIRNVHSLYVVDELRVGGTAVRG